MQPPTKRRELDYRCLKKKGLTVNEQIASLSVNPSAGPFILDMMRLLASYDSMGNEYRSVLVREACDADLTLALHHALRAAEADL